MGANRGNGQAALWPRTSDRAQLRCPSRTGKVGLTAALVLGACLGMVAPGMAAPNPSDPASQRLEALKSLAAREAEARQVPPALAEAVIDAASRWETGKVGARGEVGLMQVDPASAAALGFQGGLTALFKPEENLRYGMIRLGLAWREAGGDLCRALAAYGRGSALDECGQVRASLAEMGSPLASVHLASVPVAAASQAQPPSPETTGSVPVAPPFAADAGGSPPPPKAPDVKPFEMRPSDLERASNPAPAGRKQGGG